MSFPRALMKFYMGSNDPKIETLWTTNNGWFFFSFESERKLCIHQKGLKVITPFFSVLPVPLSIPNCFAMTIEENVNKKNDTLYVVTWSKLVDDGTNRQILYYINIL